MKNKHVLFVRDKINGRFIDIYYPLVSIYTKEQLEEKFKIYKNHVINKIKQREYNKIYTMIIGNITFSIYPFIKNNLPKVLTIEEWFRSHNE